MASAESGEVVRAGLAGGVGMMWSQSKYSARAWQPGNRQVRSRALTAWRMWSGMRYLMVAMAASWPVTGSVTRRRQRASGLVHRSRAIWEPIGPRRLDSGVQSLSPISASALITTSTVTSTRVCRSGTDQGVGLALGGGAGVALLVGVGAVVGGGQFGQGFHEDFGVFGRQVALMSAMPCPAGVIHTRAGRRLAAQGVVGVLAGQGQQFSAQLVAGVGLRSRPHQFEFFSAGSGCCEQVVDHDGFGLVDAPVVQCGPTAVPGRTVPTAVSIRWSSAAGDHASMVASSSAAPLSG